ncbi:hypothetical protein HWV62_13984 [Athelia sp. TMB]|nr:hypothetical protein HWV62_13984 [Athelia sp. TMB]
MEELSGIASSPQIHPPTRACINGLLWVSPQSSTVNNIHASAVAFKSPHFRLIGVTETGDWRGLDWEKHADWYDMRVPWRGYLPVDALVARQWETSDEFVTPVGSGFRLSAKVATWRQKQIEALREHLEVLCEMLCLEADGIPYPGAIDLQPLAYLQPTKAAVRKAMGVLRYHFLDMIAFYRWAREAMDDELIYREWDRTNPAKELWQGWEDTPVIGYLIDLQENRKVHNLPMWRSHGVPVHYVWNETLAADERYDFWSPETLRATDETPGMGEDVAMRGPSRAKERGGWISDDWCQIYNPSEDRKLEAGSQPGRERAWTYWVQDFEGWEIHQVTSRHEIELFAQIYVYEDQVEGPNPKRTFLRWRERAANAAEIIAASVYEPHHYALHYVREVYKFKYGIGPDYVSTSRSLLSRIGGSARARREETSQVAESSRQARNVDRVESRERGRERSASPRSTTSSGRRGVSPEPVRARPLASINWEGASSLEGASGTPSQASSLVSTSPIQPPLRGRMAVLAVKPALSLVHLPDIATEGKWSKDFLLQAVISFPKPRAQWRIRSWLFEDPALPATQLLGRALSYCIPFQLEIPEKVLRLFFKPKTQYVQWERDAALYYRPGYRDQQIDYTANGAELAELYQGSVLPLLRKPNAPAFLFEGGLLARIARHFGGQDLIDRALKGVSAAVTLHRAGETSMDRDTRRESVTTWEQQVLLGYTKIGPNQKYTHSVFPPVATFEEFCIPYEEAWTDECEDWFQHLMRRLMNNAPLCLTEGGWRNELRRFRRQRRMEDGSWQAASAEILAEQGPTWENQRVKYIRNLDAAGNRYE